MMTTIALTIGYYTIATYVIGAFGIVMYWWMFRHYSEQEAKQDPELWHFLSLKRGLRFVAVAGLYWWMSSPFTVPYWLIRLTVRCIRKGLMAT